MLGERTYTRFARTSPLKGLAGGLLAGILFAACQGDNLFVEFGGQSAVDSSVRVEILDPPPGQITAKPLSDSLPVMVDLFDTDGVTKVVFEGLALRGDVGLGTDVAVSRFTSKTVDFLNPVSDTVLTRYLQPIPGSILEVVAIIVTAFDADDNVTADTVQIFLGGPSVQILNFVGGEVIQAGRTLGIRVQARDPIGVKTVSITVSGVVDTVLTQSISPVRDSLVLDTIVFIPAGLDGPLTLSARAWNTVDVVGLGAPIAMTVTSVVGGADVTPPGVTFATISTLRSELGDVVRVEVTAQDDPQGGGVARMGFTALGISPRRGDTLVVSDEVVFATPRTGAVTQSFEFQVFNADFLALPDTMIYEVFAYAVDESVALNCGASVGEPALVTYQCGTLNGFTVAQSRTGLQLTLIIVAGRSVLLPTGGRIMDAVIDTIRSKLYLSNIDNGRLEIFRLQDETFETAVQVGSEPWGLTLNRGEDTLLVANSGGENVDMVYLGATDGSQTPVDDPSRRLITPPVTLFDVEEGLDDTGNTVYSVSFIPDANPPGFSNRPQYIAVDSTGRILYSTKTTILGDFGTIRKAFVPTGQPDTEVKLFVQHAAMIESPSFTGVAHADLVVAERTGFNDNIIIEDHTPGDRNAFLTFTGASPAAAGLGIQGLGSDVVIRAGQWSVGNVGFSDTTYVSASGNGGWVVFGEGAVQPVARVIMYNAAADVVSGAISVANLMINGSETVRGVGLNNDGTLGVALGDLEASFFSTDNARARLQLQGSVPITTGGAGAALHPLHADSRSLDNPTGLYQPDTHLAFVGSGDRTIDVIDTFFFFTAGKIYTKDLPAGPLRAVLPFPGDNAAFTCATKTVQDQDGITIGEAVEIFAGGNFFTPHPAIGGPTEDACIVVKLVVTTDGGGVVVVDVRKSDVLRLHPLRN